MNEQMSEQINEQMIKAMKDPISKTETVRDHAHVTKKISEKTFEKINELTSPSARPNEFFQEGLSEWDPRLDRRDFLKLSASAIAMAGLSACVKPPLEKMAAYVSQPEDLVLGEPRFFATHYVLGGCANGLLIETHEGRPTRIDGNPEHPANLGSASAIQQALALSLYDPDRVQNQTRSAKLALDQLKQIKAQNGRGFAVLSEVICSDVVSEQRKLMLKQFPGMTWTEYEPLITGAAEHAALTVFDQSLIPIYDFKRAACVVTLDADFINHPHFPLCYAQDFADRNDLDLYSVESSASLTGQKANLRLSLKPSDLNAWVHMLTRELLDHQKVAELNHTNEIIRKIKSQVTAHPGRCMFIAGEHLPVAIHEAVHVLNAHFGLEAVKYIAAPARSPEFGFQGLSSLTRAMNAGEISTLFILGGDPVYTAPANLDFRSALKKVIFTAHLSVEQNETASLAKVLIPKTHILEAWSDAQGFDGTLSFGQPMIAPMYGGLTESEFLHAALTGEQKSGRQILSDFYQKKWGAGFLEKFKRTLARGFLPGSQAKTITPKIKRDFASIVWPSPTPSGIFEISFREDRKLYDGRFANHPWLQELPDPLTRLTWGNALLLHPEELKKQKLAAGDEVKLELNGRTVLAPVFADPFQAKESGTIHFGYGRKNSGNQAEGMGFDAYSVWNGNFVCVNVKFSPTGHHEELACTQAHHSMEGRELIKTVKPGEKAAKVEQPVSLYEKDPIPNELEAWAMVIDLDRCTGCGACVVACQSENNIPVVGKDAVRMGREMHWIRVDRYFEESETPVAQFQPVPCMHCEKAPCEPVCPTGATVHGSGGLNQMVYNRCVGTRYCSNNCPYKVRRFNYLTYNDKHDKLSARQKNPNVSVRTRGVMEKCTYCTQRISAARIAADRSGKTMVDGAVKTACQVTCPSHAIEFGNLRDPSSRVSKLKQSHRNYGLLEELGTRPRTTYLAKLKREDA